MRYRTIMGMTIVCLLFVFSPVHAQESGSRSFKWLGEMSYSFGGDRLYSVQYTDGSTENFDAGEGFTFSGGILQYINKSYGIKYALGFKVNESRDDAITVKTTVFPLDVVPYYINGQHRVGVGLTYHMSPELDDDLFGTVKFDDAVGVVAEYSYSMFTIAYTDIEYSVLGLDFDASHFSVRMTVAF